MKHRTGYLYQRGSTWWLQYRIEGRTVKQSLGTSDKAIADEHRKKIMAPFMAGARADALAIIKSKLADAQTEVKLAQEELNPPLLLKHTWTVYENAKNRPDSSGRTMSGYASIWKRFYAWVSIQHPDKLSLRDIDGKIASEYAMRLTEDKLTASTFNQHVGFLRLVWRCLAKQIRGDENPWMEITKKRTQKLAHRHKAITPEQFDNLLKSSPDADYHDLLFILGWTGQRLVDGIMLCWDDVDFQRKVITLYPVKTSRTGKAVHVPLLPALAELLQKRRKMVVGRFVLPAVAEAYKRDRSAVCKRIQKIFTKAGLEPREHVSGVERAVTFYGAHSLRHFFATQALSAGIPGEIVKRITGHTSDDMLEGYQHVDAAMIGHLADRIGGGRETAEFSVRGSLNLLPSSAVVPVDKVVAIAGRLTVKNWQAIKSELFALGSL